MSVGGGWMAAATGGSGATGDRMDQFAINKDTTKVIRTIERNKRVFNQTYVEMPSFDGEMRIFEPREAYPPVLAPSATSLWPKVVVNSKDAIIMAWTLISGGFKPLIVYNSCNTNRGGGAKEGAITVEAELCRRTNFWKALKKIGRHYPLKYGALTHAKKVNVFKSSKYVLLDNSFDVDIVGLVFPPKPSRMVINDMDFYDNQNDRQKVRALFAEVFRMKDYDSFIFCNVGLDQPIDEFISIMNQAMAISNAAKIFVTLPAGDVAGLIEVEQRTTFIKYCTLLDTKSPRPEERADCVPPIQIEFDEQPHRGARRKKMMRVMLTEKKGTKIDEDDDSDDCKSIAQLESSEED
jgi:hypothetical protein